MGVLGSVSGPPYPQLFEILCKPSAISSTVLPQICYKKSDIYTFRYDYLWAHPDTLEVLSRILLAITSPDCDTVFILTLSNF